MGNIRACSLLVALARRLFVTSACVVDAAGRGAMRRHNAQEHRLRQKYPGRVLLSATQADRLREDAGEGETALQALPVRGPSDTRGLQERLLQQRGRDRVRLQGEVQNHETIQ